jgi:hypothetical protein
VVCAAALGDHRQHVAQQHLVQASTPDKIVRAIRNSHGVRAIENFEMESVVTSHGSWRDGDGAGEFLQIVFEAIAEGIEPKEGGGYEAQVMNVALKVVEDSRLLRRLRQHHRRLLWCSVVGLLYGRGELHGVHSDVQAGVDWCQRLLAREHVQKGHPSQSGLFRHSAMAEADGVHATSGQRPTQERVPVRDV